MTRHPGTPCPGGRCGLHGLPAADSGRGEGVSYIPSLSLKRLSLAFAPTAVAVTIGNGLNNSFHR